jgi:hypothetical protein
MFCTYEPTYEDMKKARHAAARRKLRGKIESLKMLINANPDLSNEMKRKIKTDLNIA